jgi:hypothetical protein
MNLNWREFVIRAIGSKLQILLVAFNLFFDEFII